MNHILKCVDIVKTDFVRGENSYLYDGQGKRYIDFESGSWANVLGNGHPRINRVMHENIEKVIHLGIKYPNEVAEDAAVAVIGILGMDKGKCLFLSSGSEAVEFGVQAARQVAGKPLLLTFTRSFLSSYGSAGRISTDEWYLVDWDDCSEKEQSNYLENIPFERIGAFVFEPGGSGTGFVRFPPKQIVQDVAKRVKQAGGLFVANEITTGMGRTGKWFGFQHYDIQPDIVALGKGLGNGYPVSAIALKPKVAEALEARGFHYAQSHQNDPLGCAVAREVITVLREDKWIEQGNVLGTYFLDGLKTLQKKYAVLKEARGRGMLLALEFHPHESISVAWAYHALMEKGLLVRHYNEGRILRFDPSLNIEKESIDLLLDGMDAVLKAHHTPNGPSNGVGPQ